MTSIESENNDSSAPGFEGSLSRTDWTLIQEAASGEEQRTALERLTRRYWPAIYAYIRASGRDVHEAADLAQGFVCDVMLGRNIFETADQKRGRFRSLLLTAIRNYLRQRHRHDTARKRTPDGRPPLHFDAEALEATAVDPGLTPEQAFTAQWSASLIRQVLGRVRMSCLDDGLGPHWAIFESRVARPMLFGERPKPYADLVDRLDLEDAAQAANMMITVKRRFSRELLAEVAGTVANPAYSEDELSTLLHDLERSA